MRVAAVFTTMLAVASAKFQFMMKMAAEEGYEWDVTQWTAGCIQDFMVSGAAGGRLPEKPAFTARCAGDGEGSPYRLCSLMDNNTAERRVVSKLLSGSGINGTSAQIQVSYQFTDLQDDSTWWNLTGHTITSYNRAVSPALNFSIVPDEVFGVA